MSRVLCGGGLFAGTPLRSVRVEAAESAPGARPSPTAPAARLVFRKSRLSVSTDRPFPDGPVSCNGVKVRGET